MQFSKSILIAAAALIAPLAMNASPVLSAGSLSVGDLSFGSFSCSLSKDGGAAATPNNCGQINVNGITVPGNGIQFSTLFSATNGAFDDATLGYTVSSTSGITNVGLLFNGSFAGLGISKVTETIFSAGNEVAQLVVNCASTGCAAADETQNIALGASYTTLDIQKDISVGSYSKLSGNNASLSIVDQTFTEGSATPEPASLALIGAGLLVAGVMRRKMVKA